MRCGNGRCKLNRLDLFEIKRDSKRIDLGLLKTKAEVFLQKNPDLRTRKISNADATWLLTKLGMFAPDGRLTNAGVLFFAKHPQEAFDILLEDGLIEYTMPERPKSPNQAYCLTQNGRQMLAHR